LKTSFSSSVPLPPSELQPVQLRDLRYWCTDRAAAPAARGVHYDREQGACVQPAAAGVQYDQQQRACSTKFEERVPSDELTPAAAAPAAATAAGGDEAAALTAAVGVKWAPAVLAARKAANAAAVAAQAIESAAEAAAGTEVVTGSCRSAVANVVSISAVGALEVAVIAAKEASTATFNALR
jgi:hypothetical protein